MQTTPYYDTVVDLIGIMAGPMRASTFQAAARFILEHQLQRLVETGCYRGIDADGKSTLILATLASVIQGASLRSFDINPDSVAKAQELIRTAPSRTALDSAWIFISNCDSLNGLVNCAPGSIQFAYLDSFDHDPDNPGPCQRHQLAELGIVLGKIDAGPAAILLDDHVEATGGKTALSAAFLMDRGWTLAAQGYQLLFTKLN